MSQYISETKVEEMELKANEARELLIEMSKMLQYTHDDTRN